MPNEVELVLDARATLGEGAMWWQGKLLWVDIMEEKLHVFDPGGGVNETFPVGQMVGAVVPRAKGGVALALHRGFGLFDFETREVSMICDPEDNRPELRFNHGACDCRGRFWAGTMGLKVRGPVGSLFVLMPDRTFKRMLTGITVSNGLAWNRARDKFYFIDSPTREISVFDYDCDNMALSNRRTLAKIEGPAVPDGMVIDADDNLWAALWDGGAIVCYDGRTGQEIIRYPIPAPRVTSCWFGGDHLADLYVTTARTGLSDGLLAKYPHAGGIFRLRPGVKGLPTDPYQG